MDLDLGRDLIGRSLLEHASGIDVRAFRVLADNREVHVPDANAFQRAKFLVEQANRPDIGIQIETESQREKNLGRVTLIRHARVADGAEQDRVKLAAKHVKCSRRQRDAFFEVFLRAPVELHELESRAEDVIHPAQHAHRLARDINSDSVSGYDCDAFHFYYDPTSVLYSATSAFRCDSSSFAKSIKICRPFVSEIWSAKSLKN